MWRKKMSMSHCYEDIEELRNALDEAEKTTSISDDVFRQAVSTIFFKPQLEKIPDNPFSEEYRLVQLELYGKIAGKKYSSSFEQTPFDFSHEIRQPYPYGTRSVNTVGDTLIGYGYIIKQLPLTPASRVLEVGSGYGSLSVHLAPMHVDLTCIDIDRKLLDFVSHRIANFNHRVNFTQCDIHDFQTSTKFDVVVFHETFHHCYNHLSVMHKISEILSDSGVIIFAAEPIISTPHISMPYPWGLRMDGLSLRCVHKFGWLELGFSRTYFFSMLDKFGWSYEERSIPGYHYTHMVIAKRK
jgi:2-polyprenyl-3-methyl-5-hydroxy-6-metoxy-1,4-benzoquinol methylase